MEDQLVVLRTQAINLRRFADIQEAWLRRDEANGLPAYHASYVRDAIEASKQAAQALDDAIWLFREVALRLDNPLPRPRPQLRVVDEEMA